MTMVVDDDDGDDDDDDVVFDDDNGGGDDDDSFDDDGAGFDDGGYHHQNQHHHHHRHHHHRRHHHHFHHHPIMTIIITIQYMISCAAPAYGIKEGLFDEICRGNWRVRSPGSEGILPTPYHCEQQNGRSNLNLEIESVLTARKSNIKWNLSKFPPFLPIPYQSHRHEHNEWAEVVDCIAVEQKKAHWGW